VGDFQWVSKVVLAKQKMLGNALESYFVRKNKGKFAGYGMEKNKDNLED